MWVVGSRRVAGGGAGDFWILSSLVEKSQLRCLWAWKAPQSPQEQLPTQCGVSPVGTRRHLGDGGHVCCLDHDDSFMGDFGAIIAQKGIALPEP
jgi:hypothetical protein